jgi:hypothetical protein
VDGNFNLTIYNEDDPFDAPEIVRVTAISGDTLTVTRAQEGTSATNKTSGNTWYLELTPTAKTIQDIDSEKLDVADVVDDLTSTDTDKPLSANQGKVLQDGKEPADATILKEADIVDNLTSTDTDKPLSANQGKVLQDGKLNLSGGTMTGDLTIPDKIIHSGDTNTAIRFPSADTVTVETGGTERMRVDSSGNVGIGNNNPLYILDILGSSQINHRYTGSTSPFLIGQYNDSGDASINNTSDSPLLIGTDNKERARFINTGEFGIGKTPTTGIHLDVSGLMRASTGILFGTDTASANTLDDYEEGTFTPTTSTSGYTLSTSTGRYTKIGRQVFIQIELIFSAINASSDSIVVISNLPFTNSNNQFPGIGREDADFGTIYSCTALSEATNMVINSYSGVADNSARSFATSERYTFSVNYFTT